MLIATLELHFKPDVLDRVDAVMARILKETSSFDGCRGVEVLVAAGDPAHWLVVERWQSQQADDAYRAFRASEEDRIRDLGELLDGRPQMSFLDLA